MVPRGHRISITTVGLPESKESDPGMPSRRRHEIVDRLQLDNAQRFMPRALYDGRANMFSTKDDLAGNYRVQMGRSLTKGVFHVKIQRVARIEPTDINALIHGRVANSQGSSMVVNLVQIIMQQAPNKRHGALPHTKAFFYPEGSKDLPKGLTLWHGFFQSVRPVANKLLVNVDVAHAAVYTEGPLIDQAVSFLGLRHVRELGNLQNTDPSWRSLRAFFRNVQVMVNVGTQKPKKISDLILDAGKFNFSRDGVQMTVQDHFRSKYNSALAYPNIFGIRVGKTAVFPAEVCRIIPGQLFKKKLLPEQTSRFVEVTAKKPHERLQTIRQGIAGARQQLDYGTSDFMQDAGISVNPDPVQVQGCVLNTPQIIFGSSTLSTQTGAWNLKGQHFIAPQTIRSWAIVNFVHPSYVPAPKVADFAMWLKSNLEKLGNVFEQQSKPWIELGNPVNIHGALNAACSTTVNKNKLPPPSFLLVMLPTAAADMKKSVKQWGDMISGIPTQCVRQGKFDKQGDQYINNVALKINAKIGGINSHASHAVMKSLAGTMVVGADVGHPGPGITTRPSMTSLVASMDTYFTRYATYASIQNPRQEIIEDLGAMLKQALQDFTRYPKNEKRLPRNIVFFRDGVSEGEYQEVSARELSQIDELLMELQSQGMPKPNVVFIVVGKRHHIRFFPTSKQDADNSGNCPPGLIVDNTVTSAVVQDFYLQSHSGLRGTSRPAHYIVLRNDPQWDVQLLQELAYTLCHVYASATRSVSIPAPVYYADRVCSRASIHFRPDWNYEQSDNATASADAPFDLAYWRKGFAQAKLSKMMYFL
ncbi:Piwi domain-containing protein [Amylocystis lapponica]|nr:Piwi domain-containing protein [Amylocystis lapponica]